MKKTLLFLSFAFATFTVSAQMPKKGEGRKQMSPEQRAEHRTIMMEKKLNLSAEQVDKIKEINLRTERKMMDIREEGMKNRESLKEIRREQLKAYEVVLSPQQLDGMKALREERKNKLQERKNERREFRNPTMENRQDMQRAMPRPENSNEIAK